MYLTFGLSKRILHTFLYHVLYSQSCDSRATLTAVIRCSTCGGWSVGPIWPPTERHSHAVGPVELRCSAHAARRLSRVLEIHGTDDFQTISIIEYQAGRAAEACELSVSSLFSRATGRSPGCSSSFAFSGHCRS